MCIIRRPKDQQSDPEIWSDFHQAELATIREHQEIRETAEQRLATIDASFQASMAKVAATSDSVPHAEPSRASSDASHLEESGNVGVLRFLRCLAGWFSAAVRGSGQ